MRRTKRRINVLLKDRSPTMPNLQIYIPDEEYRTMLKTDAKNAGFKHVSSYLRATAEYCKKSNVKLKGE